MGGFCSVNVTCTRDCWELPASGCKFCVNCPPPATASPVGASKLWFIFRVHLFSRWRAADVIPFQFFGRMLAYGYCVVSRRVLPFVFSACFQHGFSAASRDRIEITPPPSAYVVYVVLYVGNVWACWRKRPSVLWHCWLGDMKGIRPEKTSHQQPSKVLL